MSTNTSTISTNGFSNKVILSLTVPWNEEGLIDFLKRFENLPKMYIDNNAAAISFAGAGIVALVNANGENRFAEISRKSERLFSTVKLIPDGENTLMPRLIGGFSFGPNSNPEELWADFPDTTFVLPTYMLTRIDGKLQMTLNCAVPAGTDQDESISKMYEDIESLRLNTRSEQGNSPVPQSESDNETNNLLSQAAWEEITSNAISRIRQGDLDKVVLARVCRVKSAQQFDLSRSLELLAGDYPDCYRFWLEFNSGHAFFGATPERLVRLHGREFDTVALAGSIGSGETPEEQQQFSETLFGSVKDRHEHSLVVEDLKIRLERFAAELDIAEQPTISHLSNIQHLRTNIAGTLKHGYSILDMVEELHPTAALGGTPREDALQLIKELETQERGWYGAPIGWFDSKGDGEFVVAIRSGIVNKNEAWLYSGTGIVADSHPTSEWEESQIKLKPMLAALAGE